MSTAIVVGATGILGREIVKQLSEDTKNWKKIYALSHSKKDEYPSHVVHTHVDLTKDAQAMAGQLKGVEAEYVFFAAYLQKNTEQENWDVNGTMLENFLETLERTGAAKRLKRILLVTGGKYYGVHLGAVKNPMRESDPRVAGARWPPNFYYRQQDALTRFCEQRGLSWVVTYPNDVIGFAKGNFMNLAAALGLYAVVSREMDRDGKGLVFPGNPDFYTRFDSFTSSKLHARFCEWAALEPRAANQAFNVVNGDVESWQSLWPRVARRFGTRVRPDQFSSSEKEWAERATLADQPPLADNADELGLRGRVLPSELAQTVNLAKWSQREDVRAAWARLAEREGLQKEAFDLATWQFLDFVLGRNYDLVISMSKARDLGWTGYCDTWKSLSDAFGELEAAGVLPKTHHE